MTFTNTDLPTACLPLWNKRYIPLLCDWAGTLANPWNYHDGNVKKNLQSMWDIAYPNIEADIQPKQFIFVQVCDVLLFQTSYHLHLMCRALKESLSGMEVSVQEPSPLLRISSLPKVLKLQQDTKSMQNTCSAQGFPSPTCYSIHKEKYILLPHIVIVLANCYFACYLPSHLLPAITLTTCHHTHYLPLHLLPAIALTTCHRAHYLPLFLLTAIALANCHHTC